DSISINASLTDVPCFNDTTGTIDVTVTGGTNPYTNEWSNGETTEDLMNIGAGIYTDTVTDINGCMNFVSFEIFEPLDSMSFSHTSAEILCFGDSTGSIDLSVVGGTSPYTYLWSNTEITEDIVDIPSGVYDVTVTDSNNCTQTTSITVTQPTAISIAETHIDPICQAGTQGSIDLNVTGGTPGYTYYWNNGEITDTITQLNAGTYFCVVTDTNQCTDTISVTIVDPDAVILTETHVDVPCYGDSTGSIDITPSGGSPGYTFEWSNLEVTEDISNLSAGLYWVDAYDINNCGGFLSIVISEPDTSMYLTSSSHVNVLCFGDSTGSIDVEFAGGVEPYTYLWDNTEVTQDIQNISSGIYNLVVTDDNGCTLDFSDTITEPTDLLLSETHEDVLCFGDSTGSIDLTAAGGVTPYTYGWSNLSQNEDLTSIPAGNYTVIVADSNGCLDTLTAIVAQPLNPINLQASTTAVLCFGGDDGGIDLSTSGGTGPYSWEWSNSETSEDILDLEAGQYSVVVTDTNGCIDSLLANVLQPDAPLTLSGSATPVCFGDTTGIATVIPAGGTPGYSYLWNTGNPNDTLNSLAGLGQGTYDVTVTDTNGCENIIYITVEEPSGLDGCVVIDIPNVFTPNDDGANDLFVPTDIRNIQDYNIIIMNRWGGVMFESSDISLGWDGRTQSGSPANEGTYFWIVRYVDNYGDAGKKHGNLTLIRD
ncbi:MAG: gliding motility-associated C-terminal domain-containing protein, partial [Crocinitomicaceae bacterium]|nr:gliding motility-associated C-terminal domain-containing protein [Crocinitomicaceae bacterium]